MAAVSTTLLGRRVMMRPLKATDFDQWTEVRNRNAAWLTRWEPARPKNSPDVINDAGSFAMRCHAREREWQLGAGYGFGLFVDGCFGGEINLNSIQRGPFQNAYMGYWIDEKLAGNSYTPEGVLVLLRFAFEELGLHRVQISIVPRNMSSLRVVEKLGIRNEGLAERYLEINGTWEDHYRFAMTSEDWTQRQAQLRQDWL